MSNPKIPTPPASAIRRPWAQAAVVTSITFMVLLALMHFLKPDLDPSWRAISEYALGDWGWLMTIAFFSLAACCFSLFFAISTQVKNWPARIGLAGIFLAGIGFVMAGVFPTDPITTKTEDMTFSGMMHSIGPVFSNGLMLASLLLGYYFVRRNDIWRKYKKTLIVGALMTVSAFLLLGVSMAVLMPASGELGPDVTVGWQNRYMMYAYSGYVLLMALLALRVSRENS